MASQYRWVVVYLCVWLASIDSIRGAGGDPTSSNSHEQSEADYIRLQDLIRQEILGFIENRVDIPNADLYAEGNPASMQVRHLKRPRGSRWRDLLFGSDDGTQNGSGGLMSKFRRPPFQNNRVQGMNDYYVEGVNPDYLPSSQNLYPSYDYLPSGGQMMYDGYQRRPNTMWNGAGVPSSYVQNDQPPRGPGRRVGMRPIPLETFSVTGNGGPMQVFESDGHPGTYWVQVPTSGRRNNLNPGTPTSTSLPSSQAVSSGSDGYTMIPIDVSSSDRIANSAGIPLRINGKGSNQNQMSGLSVPGSQSVISESTGSPDSESWSKNMEVPRVSGGQPSSQSFAIPVETSGSGGSRIQLPVNRNNLRVENVGFPGGDAMNMNPVDVVPGLERLSNGAGIPLRINGKGSNQNQMSGLSVPGSQSVISESTGSPDSESWSKNMEVPRVSGGQPSSQSFAIPVETSGSGGSRIQLPVNRNDLRVENLGFPGSDAINMNPVDVVPGFERLSNGAGIPIRGDGKRNNQSPTSRVSIPGLQSIVSENGDILDSEGLPSNIKLPSMNGGHSSLQTFTVPTGTSGSKGSRIQLPVNKNDFPVDDGGFLNNVELPVNANGLSAGSGMSGPRVGSGGSNTEILGMNGFRPGSDGFGLKGGSENFLNNAELPVSGSGMRIGNNQITVPSLESFNLGGGGNGGSLPKMSLPMDMSRTPGSFRVTSGRGGQASPTSSSGSMQSQPAFVSMNDANVQPNYDMDIRNLEEPSYSSSTTDSPDMDAKSITNTMQTDPNQPSEFGDMMASEVESPLNLVNEGTSSITNESTSLSSDIEPSKMLAAVEDGGKASAKGVSKKFGGYFPSHKWGKSDRTPVVSVDENETSPGNVAEFQSNVDELTNTKFAEPEIQTDGNNENSKIPLEPAMNSVRVTQNGPESFTTNGNTMGPKRRGTNQPGSYYIIQHPNDFSDIFNDNVENFENQLKPQMSKFTTKNYAQQPTGGDMNARNGNNGIQSLEFGQSQNSVRPGMTRMMSSGAAGDGSGSFNVGAGRSGRPRQYKVLVVDGDHEILRGLKLPGMKPDSGVSSEV